MTEPTGFLVAVAAALVILTLSGLLHPIIVLAAVVGVWSLLKFQRGR